MMLKPATLSNHSLADLGTIAFDGYKSNSLGSDMNYVELPESDQVRFAYAAQAVLQWTLDQLNLRMEEVS